MVPPFQTGVKSATMDLQYPIETKEEETEMKITTIGLDLAKSVFHVVCFDERHKQEPGLMALLDFIYCPLMQ